MRQGPSGRPTEKTLVPTYRNGSNSNLDPDGKCAVVFMPVKATDTQQA